jgi:hypothetical protein
MSDFDLRRRTFLKLLGLAGATVVVTPAQELLLAEPVTPISPRPSLVPSQNELWARLDGRWLRVGDLVDLSVHIPPHTMLVPVRSGIAEPPVARLNVEGPLTDILSLWGRDMPFEARAYMADREIRFPYVFVRGYEIVVSETVSMDLETIVTGERVRVHPWRQGTRLS